eukprot:11819522-Karenia_brevis.AAC.1
MGTAQNQVAKRIRRSRDESSLLQLVPHGKIVEDFVAWDLSLIAYTMDEARAQLSELGMRCGKALNGLV